MSWKKFVYLSFVIILILISFEGVSAIGITPSRIIINFEPNLQVTKYACVIYKSTGVINVSARAGLAKYISLDKNQLVFNGSKTQQCVKYTLSLPSTLTPGKNAARITASETAASGGRGALGSIAAVGQQIWVIVPYPGKYLTATLKAHDAEAGEPVEFTITLNSKGNETISKVIGSIEIINQNNVSLGFLPTTEITNFKPTTTATLNAVWSPSAKDVGTYRAIATINYDGKTAEAETTFRIGELTLRLINVTSPPIKEGEIGKIDILVESVWISTISDVYAEIKASGKTAESSQVVVNPWSRKTIFVYFPTEGLEAGKYPATATVYYADKTADKEFTITVFEDKTTYYFMVGASIALMIIIALIAIFFIRQREFKRRMSHAMYSPQ